MELSDYLMQIRHTPDDYTTMKTVSSSRIVNGRREDVFIDSPVHQLTYHFGIYDNFEMFAGVAPSAVVDFLAANNYEVVPMNNPTQGMTKLQYIPGSVVVLVSNATDANLARYSDKNLSVRSRIMLHNNHPKEMTGVSFVKAFSYPVLTLGHYCQHTRSELFLPQSAGWKNNLSTPAVKDSFVVHFKP
jgi:hypothetical protein